LHWSRRLGGFALLRGGLEPVILCAFDLVKIDGDDLRWEPLEARKRLLADVLRATRSRLVLNQYIDGEDAARVFKHACGLGAEGIVSSARLRPTSRAAHTTGSSVRTRQARQCGGRRKRIGRDDRQ
jgi:ATP dependent DNA ligase domain